MSIYNKSVKICIITSILLLIIGCNSTPSTTNKTSQQANQTEKSELGAIKVGYLPVLVYAPFFVAYEKGYFTEQGLEVELEGFRGGPAMMTPLSTGQLDVGRGATGAAFFNAIHQGLDIKMVMGGPVSKTQAQREMPLLVRKDLVDNGDVTTIADLAGRKVAINVRGGTAEYLIAQVLKTGGLTINEIEQVVLPIPEMKTALENGAIDAVPMSHPFAGQFLREQIASPIISPDDIEGTFQFGGLFYGKRFLEPANQDVATKFLIAYLKAKREIYQNIPIEDDELIEIIHQYTNLPKPAIQNSPLPMSVDGQIETELLIDMQGYFIEQGLTEFSEPISLEMMVDSSFWETALNQLDSSAE